MAEFTIDDLRPILVQAFGELDEEFDTTGDISDIEFEELGLDSLALIETQALIRRRFGVRLEDGQVVGTSTPADLVAAVNAQLAAELVPARPQ
ncbi:acyl carrier protein [Nocardia brasiliensis]|uniref:acyl carrier protein n=1 Tax=Nocardia brasiliensis TaxID=37326 RepID=UPI003D93FE81